MSWAQNINGELRRPVVRGSWTKVLPVSRTSNATNLGPKQAATQSRCVACSWFPNTCSRATSKAWRKLGGLPVLCNRARGPFLVGEVEVWGSFESRTLDTLAPVRHSSDVKHP